MTSLLQLHQTAPHVFLDRVLFDCIPLDRVLLIFLDHISLDSFGEAPSEAKFALWV